MLVGRRACRLNDENVPATNVLLDLNVSFAVGERADGRGSKRHPNAVADTLSELVISGAAEDLHLGLEREHNFRMGANFGAPCLHWQSRIAATLIQAAKTGSHPAKVLSFSLKG